jgi:hypothetical protein
MSFDYTASQAKIAAAIQKLGTVITLESQSGKKTKAYGVFAEIDKDDAGLTTNQLVVDKRLLIVQGTIKSAPAVGDYIVIGSTTWSIDNVNVVQPALTILAYELTVST